MFGKRLRELREQKNYSMDKLVELYNTKYDAKMNKSTLSRYENSLQDPMYTVVVNLADLFGVSVDYIIGVANTKTSSQPEPINPPMHKIPILGTIAAGLPLYAEQHIEDYTYTDRNHGAEYFALRVKGDSMNALSIKDGSVIIVRRQEEVENGEIAVVMVNEDNATLKRFKKDGNIIQLIPQSYNPIHQIQMYDLRKDNIKIIGKAVECKFDV